MSSIASTLAITLFEANPKARENGILARANVRLREMDLTIRDFTVRVGSDANAYVSVPARRYDNARGGVSFFQYLSGDGLQDIKQAILRKYKEEFPPKDAPAQPPASNDDDNIPM